MNTKNIILGVVLAILVAGGYFFPQAPQTIVGTSSPAGTTFGNQKVASVVMAPATSAASSTSLLNTDSFDRIVTNSFVSCNTIGTSQTYLTGAGLATWTLTAATTSGASQTGNTNYAVNINPVATSSAYGFTATSTEGVIPAVSRIWPAGTYMTYTFNATNTAVCIVGSNYSGS